MRVDKSSVLVPPQKSRSHLRAGPALSWRNLYDPPFTLSTVMSGNPGAWAGPGVPTSSRRLRVGPDAIFPDLDRQHALDLSHGLHLVGSDEGRCQAVA